MGKRRNTKNQRHFYGGASDGRIVGNSDGGKRCENRFAVFEFSGNDECVEMEARDSVSHFRSNKTSSKNPAHSHPIDKYVFLCSFTGGTMASQNKSRTKPLVNVIDDSLDDITVTPDYYVSDASSDCRLQSVCSSNRDSKCFSVGEKSYAYRKGPGYFTSDEKLNKQLYIDSDNDDITEMGSRTTSFHLAENGGSAEELPSDIDTDANDCLESVVVVTPSYVKCGSMYYTKCSLTFSTRCIQMEGSSLHERKSHHSLEWPICNITKIECQPCESVKADVVNLHFKFKDSNGSGICNLISAVDADRMELEFVVTGDSQWSIKLEKIRALDPKYEDAWRTIIPTHSSPVAFEDIVYPEGDPDAVSISWRDIELLQPRTFINDTIIDFYMKYISNETVAENQHRFHFFNTFFFRKLTGLDQNSSRGCEGKEAFHRVRKWTRNLNLFEKDYIFIPVNFSLHWSLIIICHMGKVAHLREKDACSSAEMPCILHLDSLQGSHRGIENLIKSYLCEEWKERHNKLDADVSKKLLNLPFVAVQLPQQENLFDCGLFLLHYAELFLKLVPSFRTTKYFDLLHENVFLPAEVSLKKRDHIRNLIYRIAGNKTIKNPPPVDEACPRGDHVGDSDSGVKFVKEINMKDVCCCLKYDCSDDRKIHITTPVRTLNIGQHQILIGVPEARNVANSVSNDIFQPCEQFVSIQQFSNMRLPAEEEVLETPATFRPGFSAMHSSYLDGNARAAEIDIQCRTPLLSASSPVLTGIQNGEDHLPHVKLTKCSSSEDIEACVVEDSEDENMTQTVGRIRRQSFSVPSASYQLDASSHQPVCFSRGFPKKKRKGKKR